MNEFQSKAAGLALIIAVYRHYKTAKAIVQKTKKASAAFIKELMRRSAQDQIHAGKDGLLTVEHVEAALDEMLFSGGSLNVKLLGGAVDA